MQYQKTLSGKVNLEGQGIFTGKTIKVEIEPAGIDTGIIFVREDLPEKPEIPLKVENIFGLEGATAITDGTHIIYLVEHLLSALHGLQIDNAIIRVYGEEVPLLDGSAYPWVRQIQKKGYQYLFYPKKKFRIKKTFSYKNGHGTIVFKPSDTLKIKASISFDHPVIGNQEISLEINPNNYIREVCFARTFGFKDILLERIKKGILKGGDLSTAIILDREKVLNPEGLRSQDEFVRHKVLDLVGDLFGLGGCLVAEVEAISSHHRLHIEALKSLYASGLVEEIEERALTFLLVSKRKRF
ncbi:UDP-3-O-acyl-N-acetylglucosamine deacetylase [Thermodesulfobacterium sp.]|jgi:UDP-3-O-[3-hydroxymyristoyl] N-acetylglucosamine deacetylase|uniref:UDP-3-O-acyl-N-acetylglucosamine deacetylase n=1 Tax=Thermodesulfobacterium sp. TaxID=1965289 RepID=UPI00257FF60E|nr:UDP-3-O-acyl-N-acetylglucosamine deacetylase [Thermodesulfobacterium sp.]MBZ4682457.1 lpxC [Thermodesulfobacterium sp.]MDN5380355.1 UDP-3-O-[3-hydroxymyristoyl] N-acetylglucosamine deacetylase [Thermodesulfobacterium sp.]